MIVHRDQLDRAARWSQLLRWERRELGRDLRRLGLSYRQIGELIPVGKGTLSGWCRDLPVPDTSQSAARVAAQARNGAATRRRAAQRAAQIREEARRDAEALLRDPLWVAGVVAYWSEGAKTSNDVVFSNSDPDLVLLFIKWAIRYLHVGVPDLTARLHLHAGQDELERKRFWSAVTGIPLRAFHKSFVKPEGTGHRKRHLYHGTASVRVRRSSQHLQRILGWMDAIADGGLEPLD